MNSYKENPWDEPLDVYEARTQRTACVFFVIAVLIWPFVLI